jgi:hypothetical protein
MKPLGICLVALQLLTFGLSASGQVFDEESNWYKEIGIRDDYYSRFDFTRYTKEDVQKAKDKYLSIASVLTNDEWSGTYRRQTMLGGAEITWDRKKGFVYTYVYHTLAGLDFGKVKTVRDSVSFVPERLTVRKVKHFFEGEHIQVKFGEKHLLVPKSRLAEFAIWAAGREVPTGQRAREIYTEEGFFWEKAEDENKKIADIPTFPIGFVRLIRKPILSKVLSVGPLRIKREKSADWGTTSVNHFRTLTLAGGQENGVKTGMRFWIDDLEEWVEVVSVTANHSRAVVHRPFIDGREYCDKYENYGLTEFPCRDPKVGMVARTRVDYF